MSKIIKSVEFVFENCETLVLNYPDIFMFNVWGQKESYHSYSNCIALSNSVAGFYVGVSKDAKPTEESCLWCEAGKEGEEAKLSRLWQYRDVTHLIVMFDDDSRKSYGVEWPDSNEWHHPGQVFWTTEQGHTLYASIMKGSSERIPSLEEVNAMADMAL